MYLTSLIVRLLLASVFALAGVLKLRDRKGTRQAFIDFGVPIWAVERLATAIPIVEIALAVLLVPVATAAVGGLGATALIAAFSIAIAFNLAQGKTPECHCFGQLHSEPIGLPTLFRNVVLMTLGLWVGVVEWNQNGLGLTSLRLVTDSQSMAVFVAIVVLALTGIVEGILILQLLRQQGRFLMRIEALELGKPSPDVSLDTTAHLPGLPVGMTAPAFSLPGADGVIVSLANLLTRGNPVLLIFSDSQCGPCRQLAPTIASWQASLDTRLTVAIIGRSGKAGTPASPSLKNVLLQRDREVQVLYNALGTPSAVLIGRDGLVQTSVQQGGEAITSLVSSLTTVPQAISQGVVAPASTPAVGIPAPEIELPNVSGGRISLKDFAGDETFVLFWNPNCGYCMRMLPDIKAWENTSAPLRLLIVSTGTVDANLKLELRSKIALDTNFRIGREFGAPGTPAGVLVDRRGKIASSVTVGAESILKALNAAATAGVTD